MYIIDTRPRVGDPEKSLFSPGNLFFRRSMLSPIVQPARDTRMKIIIPIFNSSFVPLRISMSCVTVYRSYSKVDRCRHSQHFSLLTRLVCEMKNPTMSQYLTALNGSSWLQHIRAVLDAASFIARVSQSDQILPTLIDRWVWLGDRNWKEKCPSPLFGRMGSYRSMLLVIVSASLSILSIDPWIPSE